MSPGPVQPAGCRGVCKLHGWLLRLDQWLHVPPVLRHVPERSVLPLWLHERVPDGVSCGLRLPCRHQQCHDSPVRSWELQPGGCGGVQHVSPRPVWGITSPADAGLLRAVCGGFLLPRWINKCHRHHVPLGQLLSEWSIGTSALQWRRVRCDCWSGLLPVLWAMSSGALLPR